MATVTRIFEFDAAHRVMNEKVKCFNLHGHRFKVEATFSYDTKGKLGYAIDFKEIKRLCGEFIDEFLDHACILNPLDEDLIGVCKKNNWRMWIMGLGNGGDINPSAENIASELWFCFRHFLWKTEHGVELVSLRLYETPNCWVDTQGYDYHESRGFHEWLQEWRLAKGNVCYDVREK